MSLRLYLDEDAAHGDLIEALVANGFDVESALTQGLLGRPDIEQLEKATANLRIIATSNARDYHALHSA